MEGHITEEIKMQCPKGTELDADIYSECLQRAVCIIDCPYLKDYTEEERRENVTYRNRKNAVQMFRFTISL
ncbi:MAG: hypothetical protein ABIF11_11660 [Nitrospirota bacterium]